MDPSRVLIIKTSSLGDIIHSFPVLQYLKERFPQVKVDWVVEGAFSEMVRAHPQIDNVIVVKTKSWRNNFLSRATWSEIGEARKLLRKQKYDLVIDLQGNLKSGIICFNSLSKNKIGFGWKTVPEKLNLLFTNIRFNPPLGHNIRSDYLYLVQNYFSDFENSEKKTFLFKLTDEQKEDFDNFSKQILKIDKKKIMVCPGSFWKNKQLNPPALKSFLKELSQDTPTFFVFVWGNQTEQEMAIELQSTFKNSLILPKISLAALQHLMASMDLVVAMDSLPLHLAGTTNTPTYSFFGPSAASKYKPEGSQHLFYQGQCPYGRTFEKRCPILRTCETGACLHSLPESSNLRSF